MGLLGGMLVTAPGVTRSTCHKTARSLVEPVLKIQTLNQSQTVTTVIPTVTIGQGRATVLTALIRSGWEKTARSLATSVVRKKKREKKRRRRRKIFLRLTATIGIQRSARRGSRKDTAPTPRNQAT